MADDNQKPSKEIYSSVLWFIKWGIGIFVVYSFFSYLMGDKHANIMEIIGWGFFAYLIYCLWEAN